MPNPVFGARDTDPWNEAWTALAALAEATSHIRLGVLVTSLALHYIQDIAGVFSAVHRALVPGGPLIFSIEHPINMAPRHPEWTIDSHGHKTWPLNQYSLEDPRITNWLAEGVVKQHRTHGTILNHLIRSGFAIACIEEWAPTDEQIAAKPELIDERERPMFLLVAARR